MYFFGLPQGQVSLVKSRSRPYWSKKVRHIISINREAPSLIWTHCKLKEVCPKEEEDKFTGEEEEKAAEDNLSLGFLSLSGIVLSDKSILKKLLGFLPFGFPKINSLCLSFMLCLSIFQ